VACSSNRIAELQAAPFVLNFNRPLHGSMKKGFLSSFVICVLAGSLFAQSPFPLPSPARPTNFPLSIQTKQRLGNDVRTFGTVFEWREEILTFPDSGGWYTALIPLAPPASFPKGVLQIAEGSAFSAALKNDGQVFTWGQESFTFVNVLRSFLESFASAKQVLVAGSEFAAAVLLENGTVQQSGLELPDGTLLPAPPDLRGVVQIAMGLRHIVALKSDGTVVTWGAVADGIDGAGPQFPEFPNYTYAPASSLVPGNLGSVVQVEAAFHHAFALRSDGTVVGWGYKSANPWEFVPAYVPPALTNVVQIATSETITAALKGDGTVSVWAFTNSIPPEYSYILPPSDLTNVVKVAVGNEHGMALINDGTVRSWGRYARPRDGEIDESSDPLVNSFPADSSTWTNIIDIAAGNESGYGLVWNGEPSIRPVITLAVREPGGFAIEWSDELNRSITVQRRSSLSSGAWSNVSTNVRVPRFVDPAPPAGAAFYRLVVP